ncbi:catalase A [Coemansia spiralis]|uniref:Catalase n=1 Tax=Coemansia spiralis TaxID=417178 RepID=A0A9W8KZV4_9FUNG|nr:catalase A [Coemansia spiralis]
MKSTDIQQNSHLGTLTTGNGNPVPNNQTSQTAGYYGPVLIQVFHLIDNRAHFDRERIPERVVHAKGAGAHGYFEVTKDISHLTCAKFLNQIGKRTPVFARFSTVGGESGSADTARDPLFFVRDPIKFPDFIHTQKRDPRTHMKNPDMQWDFWSHVPEALHQVMILFSNRGTPDGYRHMHGYSSHTLKLVKENGEFVYVKWHFRTNQGIKNLSAKRAAELEGTDPDYATRDLFEAIEKGDHPSWTVYVQVFSEEEAMKLKYNPFDVTKVVSQKDFPLQEVGRMVEQAAFSPSHMVPGVAPSPDRMLQGRLFSYPDTHRHRLGANYLQLPINRPTASVRNHQRDGPMCFSENGGRLPNYEPNSFGGPQQSPQSREIAAQFAVEGTVGRHSYGVTDEDFDQPRALYRLLDAKEQQDLVDNIAGNIALAKPVFQRNILQHIKRIDEEFGARVETILKQKTPDLTSEYLTE